jgi:hypothetical protein
VLKNGISDSGRDAIKNKISQDEVSQIKPLTGNLDYSKDNSLVWLKVREILKLGLDQKYPIDMMKHHY